MPLGGVPPQQPIDCSPPGADRRIDGVRLWNTGGCQHSRHTMTIRQPEQYTGNLADYISPGYFETISEHPMRAANRAPSGNAEACGFHFGHVAIGRDGFFQAWYGSEQPYIGESKRITPLRPHIKEAETMGDTPVGYWYFAGRHQGRKWTEALLHSGRRDCKGVG